MLQKLPYRLLLISLEPSNRHILHKRISDRFKKMLDQDLLINEVKKIRKKWNLNLNLPSMKCIGYRQTWEYIDGLIDRNTLKEKSIIATRQLAKQQLTWLRNMNEKITIDCLEKNCVQKILNLIKDIF
ncbi:tRNA dimethylallyltransferase [Candidatus Profftella armatura]|uniref:Split tRNA delta(2)-isopentenylpyrophosphate transferase n=1 Tax=Candidatus Profftella armatura TaxID=669502 RepID=S5RPS9_9PROT|nr:tRNA dimethylallyltransferase [Candidatus Profftella armatura]AGS06873.1 split tRNA delta(2)-isopentenylpyrophosphate transferase [Candidatus Profftella armatura]